MRSQRRSASFFLDRGVKIVGLKMGSEGSYVRSATEEYWIPPYKVEAVDATGAGDSFVAGFLAGLSTDGISSALANLPTLLAPAA